VSDSVIDIVIDALRATDLDVGDAQARDGTTQLAGRYVIVWPNVDRPYYDQPITDPNADLTIAVQLMSVGPSRRAADQVAMQARAVALGPLQKPTGYAWRCPAEFVVSQPTDRDKSDDPSTPESAPFYRSDIYRYYITPE
jgi:hypothetical protein